MSSLPYPVHGSLKVRQHFCSVNAVDVVIHWLVRPRDPLPAESYLLNRHDRSDV